MTVLRYILLILHFVGLAAILGPWLDQLRLSSKRITNAMVWGARAQIITGLGLVGVAYATDHEPDHFKIGVKLLVALVIVGLAEANRKKKSDVTVVWWLIGLLTIANIIVAVSWH